jgi:hypothetical protein
MKIAVCLRQETNLHRIAWLNESRAGVYFGVFTKEIDLHTSYHADGRTHTKVGTEYFHKSNAVPLRDFSGARQISHQAFGVPDRGHDFWPKHDVFKTWDSMLVIDRMQFQRAEWLAVDIWLFDTNSFPTVERRISEMHARDTNFRPITNIYHQLSCFPGLNLGLFFRAASDSSKADA